MTYDKNQEWVLKMQPYAINQHYNRFWPDAKIISLDDDTTNELKNILDVSGADKLLKWPNGTISFLAQRFRRWGQRKFDDFTLRKTGSYGGKGEIYKVIDAIDNNKIVSSFYAYGHVNENENGFIRFRIIDYKYFLQLWKDNIINPPIEIPNKNRQNLFFKWPFNKIPDECILYQYPQLFKQLKLGVPNLDGTIKSNGMKK